jgi:hypothetical protein
MRLKLRRLPIAVNGKVHTTEYTYLLNCILRNRYTRGTPIACLACFVIQAHRASGVPVNACRLIPSLHRQGMPPPPIPHRLNHGTPYAKIN